MLSHLILKSDIPRFKFFCAWRMTSVRVNVKYTINYDSLNLYTKPSIHYITTYFWHFDATFCIRVNILANPCMEKLDWEYTRALRRVDHLLCFQIWWRIQQGYVSSCRFDSNTTCVSPYISTLRTTIFQTPQCWHLEESSKTKRLLPDQKVDHCRGILILCFVLPSHGVLY